MTDGAHLGISPHDAMSVAVRGDTEAAERTNGLEVLASAIEASVHPDEFRTVIAGDSYNNGANYAAKLILAFLLAHPEYANLPAESHWDWKAPKDADGHPPLIQEGLSAVMKREGVDLDDLDLTGFMYGWAVNAARVLCELPPVPNPAIVTIGGEA